ncbi:TonB-dependent receptor [Pedobacter sp. Leaf250]|uniref:TonB-dependent receptor n=1 Tax=Pedobacter sp. Leaf250 TaxID=2876559 RepID=UPI001E54270E|nr:TonB-dependent receptor [Pedobacter sp. Leaf250]
MKKLYILLLLVLVCFAGMAQIRNAVTGKVVDPQNRPLELVNIKVIETNQYATTDKFGIFRINGSEINNVLTLEISYIGFQKLRIFATIKEGETNLGNINLKVLDLSLENIEINAKRNYSGQTNSSLVINRDLIEQIPALSVNDLLNQIPNRKITPPSLQNVQNLTLRSTFAPTTSGRSDFELNNSFGVAIILDGNPISNNANMQSRNVGISGMGGSAVTSGAGYGLRGSGSTTYSGDYAFGGTDLRQIPADNIESIEVISGVAPVKYGDLTDGAVIIERQAGVSPTYVRMQLRDNATSYSLSKGLKLSDKLGSLNLGANYVNSFADNRDKLKEYRRINTNAMWTNSYGKDKALKNTFSFDYGRNLDGIKQDPDDPKSTKTRFDSWNLSLSNRTSYRFSSNFFKSIGLNLNYAEGHQVTYDEQLVNEAYVLYSDAVTTGITRGKYDSGVYTAVSQIDGRPINFSARLDLSTEFKTGNITHYLSFGTNYSYSANKGLGQVVDPNAPRGGVRVTSTTFSSKNSERYYDFNLANAIKDAGFYTEDMFKVKLFDRDLNVRAGVRADIQNGYASFAPRTNLNYGLSKNVRVGLAYGLSFKSPGLAQRYPGPTFREIPLLNAYNGNVNESIYLLYVNRYEPNNENLKASKSETIEFTTQIKLKDFNLSVSAYNKTNSNGISTVHDFQALTLPTYSAVLTPGQPAAYTQTGSRIYSLDYYRFDNDLRSENQGFEIVLSTPEIKEIATSFNISGGFSKTAYQSTYPTITNAVTSLTTSTNPKYAVTGVYEPNNRSAYFSSGRITASTHIPKVSLILQLTAEFDLYKKTVSAANQNLPVAYYTLDNSYVVVNNFDRNDPLTSHLYRSPAELSSTNLPKIISNYHLSIAKEIKKRFRFSFNVYNVLNYQPYYTSTTGSLIFPNTAPTFGAEMSLKL